MCDYAALEAKRKKKCELSFLPDFYRQAVLQAHWLINYPLFLTVTKRT